MNFPNKSGDLESVPISLDDFATSKTLINGYFPSFSKYLPSDNKSFWQRMGKKGEILHFINAIRS